MLVEDPIFFLAGAAFDVAPFDETAFADVVLSVALSTGADSCAAPPAGGLPDVDVTDESDWAAAGGKKPSAGRKKIQRKPRPLNAALKPYLLPEVGTYDGEVVFARLISCWK